MLSQDWVAKGLFASRRLKQALSFHPEEVSQSCKGAFREQAIETCFARYARLLSYVVAKGLFASRRLKHNLLISYVASAQGCKGAFREQAIETQRNRLLQRLMRRCKGAFREQDGCN